jgi:hypothetical protein
MEGFYMSASIIRLLRDQEQARMKKTPEERKMIIRPEDLSDEHINHRRRFAGLPPRDAKELERWRGYLRWMRGRFAPDPPEPAPLLDAQGSRKVER